MTLIDELKNDIKDQDLSIVFPEATDPRVLGAAVRLQEEGIVEPVLIGSKADLQALANEKGWSIAGMKAYDPANYADKAEMVERFVDRRKGKVSTEEAEEILLDVNYFGSMLVYMDKVDGMVSGAVHSTSDTVRPALQIVKTRPDLSLVSGSFIMYKEVGERYYYADAGLNPKPTAEELADIAVESARMAEAFGIQPAKVAMLSYSTYGSAGGEDVEKVQRATRLAQEKAPQVAIDGELQFDAAIVPSVAASKAPDSEVAGQANVFIFPDLSSGNIAYKITQRLGGFNALGPLLQGMGKPINDLSRGCSEDDVYEVAIVTAKMAMVNH